MSTDLDGTKSNKTIAISYPDTPDKVQLWCSYTEHHDHILFFVLNGAWDGRFENGFVTIKGSSHSFPAKIVWKGKVPSRTNNDYNMAINWIEGQIKNGQANG